MKRHFSTFLSTKISPCIFSLAPLELKKPKEPTKKNKPKNKKPKNQPTKQNPKSSCFHTENIFSCIRKKFKKKKKIAFAKHNAAKYTTAAHPANLIYRSAIKVTLEKKLSGPGKRGASPLSPAPGGTASPHGDGSLPNGSPPTRDPPRARLCRLPPSHPPTRDAHVLEGNTAVRRRGPAAPPRPTLSPGLRDGEVEGGVSVSGRLID